MLEYVALGDFQTAVGYLLASTPEKSARYYRDALCTLALAVCLLSCCQPETLAFKHSPSSTKNPLQPCFTCLLFVLVCFHHSDCTWFSRCCVLRLVLTYRSGDPAEHPWKRQNVGHPCFCMWCSVSCIGMAVHLLIAAAAAADLAGSTLSNASSV